MKQNKYRANKIYIKNIFIRIIFFLAGCIGTGVIYFLLILIWGFMFAPWIRIVHSNIISLMILLLSGFLTWILLKKIVERFQEKDQENYDLHR